MTVRLLAAAFALSVLAPSAFAQQADPPRATSFSIKGAVDHPKTLTLPDLQREPAASATVFLHTGKGVLSGTFSGVSLWTLLQEAGIKTEPGKKNDNIRHTVAITAADGYSVVLSLGEIDPEFGGDQAIVATAKDGKPLDGKLGFARLVIPGDKSAGRSIDGIASIEVR